MEEEKRYVPEDIGDSKYNRQAAIWVGVAAVLVVFLLWLVVTQIDFRWPDSSEEAPIAEAEVHDTDEQEPEAEDAIEEDSVIPVMVKPAPTASVDEEYEEDASIGEIDISSADISSDLDDAVEEATIAADRTVKEAEKAADRAVKEAEKAIEEADKALHSSGYGPTARHSSNSGRGSTPQSRNRKQIKNEYSSLDELERQSHAEAVKQAKAAGVSTSGSTLDILERINHAEAVKQAKAAGVSTSGSTLDILERINRKELSEY